jgi:N-dimethylarginine dimethylaminohydrolase
MVDPMRRVLVKRPDASFAVQDPSAWHYSGRPDLGIAEAEHDAFVALLKGAGVEVVYHDVPQPGRADAIFVHDPAIITDRGAILLRMGKRLREGEEAAIGRRFEEIDVPIFYELHGEARAEGGDLLWIDHDLLAVGQGFRTNAEGLRQLREALTPIGVKTLSADLPYGEGPDACLHLMSLISLVRSNLAVIYEPLLPTPLHEFLAARGVHFILVPDEEFETMGCNVLAMAPGECIMLEGNPVTQAGLEKAGCRVRTYRGNEITLKAEGGATCLTRPLFRR